MSSPPPTSPETSPEPAKACRGCAANLPLASFGYLDRKRGTRKTRCRRCDARYMTLYRLRRSGKRFDGVVAAVLKESSLTRLGAFLNNIMGRFGGQDQFARLWHQNLMAAPLGSRRAVNLWLGLAQIMAAKEANPQPAADLRSLTDEELNQLVAASVAADAAKSTASAAG